ncbi:hypothetical protein CQY20_05650 [Mycolicibacterium agri]|uniref:Uncharacterized protein n=1 Tax=Mycolicibacterium agri TaxID=36811 RepID=A0A2A7NBC0_MYCAG|nr:hypothetical protein [Mycolicibacterium agri]PEG41136.1 hypothetical protein CQY20_05650 [Mycolicibacterium agri]GFG55428.1 hypothetical protein MAGR_68690 [Mycolicibacterium agri]
MNTTHSVKKVIVGALTSGGLALAALGFTTGVASASPSNPQPNIDVSDWGVPVVECIQCNKSVLGGASEKVNPGIKVGDSVRVSTPKAKLGDGSVRVATPSVGN